MVRQGYKEKGETERRESVSHELCTCMAVLEYVMMEGFLLFMSENKSVQWRARSGGIWGPVRVFLQSPQRR